MNLIAPRNTYTEYILVGSGPIPRKALTQALDEIDEALMQSDPDDLSIGFLPVAGTPSDSVFQTISSFLEGRENSGFYSYLLDGMSRADATWSEWARPQYVWTDEDLEAGPDEGHEWIFLVLLHPDGLTQELGEFLIEALSHGYRCLVLNEGLWEIDRIDGEGLYEKMDEIDGAGTDDGRTQSRLGSPEAAPAPSPVEEEDAPGREEGVPESLDTDSGHGSTTSSSSSYTQESLEELSRDELKEIVNELGATPKDFRAKQNLIDAILEAQGPVPLVESIPTEDDLREVLKKAQTLEELQASADKLNITDEEAEEFIQIIRGETPETAYAADKIFDSHVNQLEHLADYHRTVATAHAKLAAFYQEQFDALN